MGLDLVGRDIPGDGPVRDTLAEGPRGRGPGALSEGVPRFRGSDPPREAVRKACLWRKSLKLRSRPIWQGQEGKRRWIRATRSLPKSHPVRVNKAFGQSRFGPRQYFT